MNRMMKILAVAMAIASTTAQAGDLRVVNGRFVDARGATVVLRGLNLSQWEKMPPFRPNTDPLLFQKLSAMGVNVVRQQFNWEAYETAPGVYDESYLDYYAGVVDRAAAAGIYVYVDIHQDSFSRWSLDGCGEGFPRWAIPAGFPVSTPDNGSKCYFWPLRVIAEENQVNSLFNAFYAAGNPARERYLALLEKLATRFAGYHNVIGYDLLNEPMGDAAQFGQLYVEAINRVRKHDPDAIAFIEPEMLTGAGVQKTALTRPPISNMAFSPHYYDATIYASIWLGGRYEPVAANNRALANAWGAAVMLGEFGSPSFWQAPAYIGMIYDDLDKFGDSATQWSYTPEWTPQNLDGWNREDLSIIDNNGKFRLNYRERPYARRTAGSYGSFSVSFPFLFTPASATYNWVNNPGQGTTEIFVPDSFLGGRAPVVKATAGITCSFNGSLRLEICSGAAGPAQVTLH